VNTASHLTNKASIAHLSFSPVVEIKTQITSGAATDMQQQQQLTLQCANTAGHDGGGYVCYGLKETNSGPYCLISIFV